jgi:ATP-dependent helicase/DNAse subunit B
LQVVQGEIQKTQWSPEPGASGGGDFFRVSATSLNAFFYCPASWFFDRILHITEYSLEAELMDDMALGNLYHEILKNLFQKIQDRDRRFLPEHIADYQSWAKELTGEAAEKFRAFQGPLSVPLMSAQSGAISGRIARLLETEADYFPRHTVVDLERQFSAVRRINALPVLLTGKLDRVSVSEDDEPVIIDYKTNYMPAKTGSAAGEDGSIGDYQMAMYVKLYEENSAAKIGGAYFMSVKQNDINAIIGKPKKKRGFTRDEYQPTLEALDAAIGRFAAAVDTKDFSPNPVNRETCGGCVYKHICRTAYVLNSEPGSAGAAETEGGSGGG